MTETLKKLEKRLYGQDKNLKSRFQKNTLEELKTNAPEEKIEREWKETMKKKPVKISFMAKLIVGLTVFAAIVVSAAVIYLFGGFGAVSSNQIGFEISGSPGLNGGEKAVWRVTLENNNDSALENAEIIFNYPAGSQPAGQSAPLSGVFMERRNLGKVYPGELINETFEAFVFGEEKSLQRAAAVLEYRVQGSNAILAKETFLEAELIKSAVGVTVNLSEHVNIGQEIEAEIVYFSNAREKINNLTIQAVYPDGFEFISATPEPSFSDNTWEIKSLAPQGQGSIRLKGKFKGENLENKVFKSLVGVRDAKGGLVVYGAAAANAVLRSPFLDLTVKINGQDNYVASFGDQLDVAVFWKNNLPVSVKNAVLEVKLAGAGLDYSKVLVNRGFYRSNDRAVVWNSSSDSSFAFLDPGQEGEASFRINVLRTLPSGSAADANHTARFDARMFVAQRPVGFEGVDIDGRFFFESKIASNLQLSRQGYFYSTLIPNSGPLPPRAGQKTTYTVVWSLANSSNNLKNVKVYASLPSYISWEGNFLPLGENISYDKINGRVIWQADSLPAGTGILRPAVEAAFQIGIIPSLAQVGTSPVLISEAIAEGEDEFAGLVLRDAKNALTTRLFTDPQIKNTEYEVIQ